MARSAVALFALITLVTVSCAGYVYFEVPQEKAIAIAKRELDRTAADGLLRMTGVEKKIRTDVARVQQILTDASSAPDPTHAKQSLAGLAPVEGQFANDMAEAKAAAKAYGGVALVAVFEDVEKHFPEYYARGVARGGAYAAGTARPPSR